MVRNSNCGCNTTMFSQLLRKNVKRWLGELKGKDLPESFAWSSKRLNHTLLTFPSYLNCTCNIHNQFCNWQLLKYMKYKNVLKGSQIHTFPLVCTLRWSLLSHFYYSHWYWVWTYIISICTLLPYYIIFLRMLKKNH